MGNFRSIRKKAHKKEGSSLCALGQLRFVKKLTNQRNENTLMGLPFCKKLRTNTWVSQIKKWLKRYCSSHKGRLIMHCYIT